MTSTDVSRQILVGIDAVHPGQLAAAWAADEAHRRHLPLRLVHAVPPVMGDLPVLGDTAHHRALLRRGEQALDAAAAFARERHPELDLSTLLADEYPAWSLCEQARYAALVVLGSRHLHRAEELLSAGSVTVPVSAQAPCPVVVVAGPEHIVQQPAYLVIGVDGSPTSQAAVDFAIDAAALRGAALRTIWVWQPPMLGSADEPGAIQECRRRLSEAVAGRRETHPDVDLTHEVLRGHPVEELAKASEHALAVVVGRRGHGGFTGMRLGSVPHGLLQRAHCPVITVPATRSGGS
jgi:nucleotide-binding universal stress UspA family protein